MGRRAEVLEEFPPRLSGWPAVVKLEAQTLFDAALRTQRTVEGCSQTRRSSLPRTARNVTPDAFVLRDAHARVGLRLFAMRHTYAPPPQVVAGLCQRQFAKRHMAGSLAHLFKIVNLIFGEHPFHVLG